MKQKTSLYRHFDSEGRLLYVGISYNALARLSQHENDKPWADDICSVTIQHFESRNLAIEAECAAIKKEKPLHNIIMNKPLQKGSGAKRSLPRHMWTYKVSINNEILSMYKSWRANRKYGSFDWYSGGFFIGENLKAEMEASGIYINKGHGYKKVHSQIY